MLLHELLVVFFGFLAVVLEESRPRIFPSRWQVLGLAAGGLGDILIRQGGNLHIRMFSTITSLSSILLPPFFRVPAVIKSQVREINRLWDTEAIPW